MASSMETPEGDVIAEINVVPFVDIALVLLIIVMVTSAAIVRSALAVDLPRAASAGAAVESTLNIVYTRDQQLLLNGERTTEGELAATTRAQSAANPGLQAVIAADQGVPYGAVVAVIDLLKQNGVTTFALNIERRTD